MLRVDMTIISPETRLSLLVGGHRRFCSLFSTSTLPRPLPPFCSCNVTPFISIPQLRSPPHRTSGFLFFATSLLTACDAAATTSTVMAALLTTAQSRWLLSLLVGVLSAIAIGSSAPKGAGGEFAPVIALQACRLLMADMGIIDRGDDAIWSTG